MSVAHRPTLPTLLAAITGLLAIVPASDAQVPNAGGDGIRICGNFAGANTAVRLNACITDLPPGGGIADARALIGSHSIASTVRVGDGSKRVQLLLAGGGSTYRVSTPVGFMIARGSEIVGAGMESATVIVGDNVVPRTLIQVETANNGEERLRIADLELRMTANADIALQGAALNRSTVENILIRAVGGVVSSGTGIMLNSNDVPVPDKARNYRNLFSNVLIENVRNGLVLKAVGTNGPNSNTFVRFSCLGCAYPVTIGANVTNTVFLSPNIETGNGDAGVVNAGTDTVLVAPFIESFAIGVINNGVRLRVVAPSWGSNRVNVSDIGTETICEACGGGGPGNRNSWSMTTGSVVVGNEKTALGKFDIVHGNQSDGLNVRNVAPASIINDSRIVLYNKNELGAEKSYGYIIGNSRSISAGHESSTLRIGGLSAGAPADFVTLVGNETAVFSGAIAVQGQASQIRAGNGAPTGNCITGSMYLRTDGGKGSTLYICESTTWAAK